jgi:hypothetical protein
VQSIARGVNLETEKELLDKKKKIRKKIFSDIDDVLNLLMGLFCSVVVVICFLKGRKIDTIIFMGLGIILHLFRVEKRIKKLKEKIK